MSVDADRNSIEFVTWRLPYHFIPVAERSGRIVRLTYQILAEALDQLRPRMKQNRTFKVVVNIGATHLLSQGFVDEFRSVVADAKVSLRQIVIEVTERDAIPDLEQAAGVVRELRVYRRGVWTPIGARGHHSHINKIKTLDLCVRRLRGQSSISIHIGGCSARSARGSGSRRDARKHSVTAWRPSGR